MRSIAVGIFIILGCDAQKAITPEPSDDRSQGRAVEPGSCLGAHTKCDAAPTAVPFPMGPLVACVPMDRDADVVWSTPLGEVSCPVGKCIAEAVDIAADPSGGTWVETNLLLPSQTVITDDRPHGLGLSRFDENGKLAFSKVVSFPALLAGDPPKVAGMRVDSRGHLLLLAPTPGRPGLEFRDYDRNGRLTSTSPLVNLARAGTASIDADGALTLFYSYEPGGDAGTADPLRAPQSDDLARFDANGIPMWNQTVSRLVWPNNPGERGAFPIFGTRATAIVDWLPAGQTPQKTVVAVFDDKGNISQVSEQQDSTLESFVPTGPTSFAAVLRSNSPENSPDFVTTFGVDDPNTPRLDAALLSFPDDELIGIDGDNRVWSVDGSGAALHAVSSDGRRCSSWRTGMDACGTLGTVTNCISPVFTVPKDGNAYFAFAGKVSAVRLGGLP